eukprot:7071662-Alexandrium_andersonii.AAC.1
MAVHDCACLHMTAHDCASSIPCATALGCARMHVAAHGCAWPHVTTRDYACLCEDARDCA